jgi:hypothetical protein
MANVWMDGFDTYAVSADLSQSYGIADATLGTTAGRFGGGGVTLVNDSSLIYAASLPLELWTGFAIYVTDTTNGSLGTCIFCSSGSNGGGIEGLLSLNATTGVLTAWCGEQQVSLGTVSIPGFTTNSWHWVDVHFKYSATVGVFEVWWDGTQILNLTGQNTANNSSQTSLVAVYLGGYGAVATLAATYDDWVINDTTTSYNNGRVGDSKIESLKPTSDVTPNNGTCSTGTTHYAMVNESQWNTSNYITMTNTSGQEELFGFASLGSTPASISAVKITYIGKKTDAGAASLETVMVSGGVEGDGASTPMLTSWARRGAVYALDPNTSAAWTYSAVNAMHAGWKVP